MHILLVREILKAFKQFLLLSLSVETLPVASVVFEIAPGSIDNLEEDQSAVGTQQATDRRKVSRSFRGSKEMGACYVMSKRQKSLQRRKRSLHNSPLMFPAQ